MPEFQEVADGVFAYIQSPGGWCVNNAGMIVSGTDVALVDTAGTRERTLRLRDQVRRVGGRDPFAVVNTHSHGDHTFGNFLFPDATIVAHEYARLEMDRAGLHLTELWPDVSWGDPEIALPTVTYRDRLTLHVGGHTAELSHFGPAHTANDTVVWLPGARVLFAGDVVMNGVTPFCPLGTIAGSLRVIDRLRALEPAVVVSGHGPVGGPEVLDVTEAYLRWIQELARGGVAAGLAPSEVAKAADLGPFAELLEPERLVANLHRAYAEERGAASGREPDVLAMIREMGVIFGEMVDYHGGPLACHA